MQPKINKILYATDLSDNSAYAFRYAINSAQKHGAEIVILHVLEPLPGTADSMIKVMIDEDKLDQILRDKVAESIGRIKKRLRIFSDKEFADRPECMDIVTSIKVVEGYPEEEILRQSNELDCDIIIMGNHGKGMISHAFLGSVAERVLRRSRKPVFVIPLPAGETDLTFHGI